MLGLPVAKFTASRENSARCEKSMFCVCGSFFRRSVRCGWNHEPTPKIGGSWKVSGVSGAAFTYGEAAARDPAAGATARGRPATAGEVDVGVEADEAGALRVARVGRRLRVPVEVPARERGGQRAAERVAA